MGIAGALISLTNMRELTSGNRPECDFLLGLNLSGIISWHVIRKIRGNEMVRAAYRMIVVLPGHSGA